MERNRKGSLLITLLILIAAGATYVLTDHEVREPSAISAGTQSPEVITTPPDELLPAPRSKEVAKNRDVVQQAVSLDGDSRGNQDDVATVAPTPSATHVLEVVVVNADGAPIEHAKVRAEVVSKGQFPRRSTVQALPTNAQGRTGFTSLPFELIRVVASAPDFASNAAEIVKLAPNAPTEKVEIVLSQGGSVVGKLMDIRGAAAKDVRLSIHLRAWPDQIGAGTPGHMQSTNTDLDGNFRFAHLPPGLYTLYTRASGEALELVPAQQLQVDVMEGETTEVAFEDLSQSFVKLTGVVMRNGEPIPNARINFGWADRSRGYLGKRCKADDDGRFQILLDEAGGYRVQISGTGGRGSVFREIVVPAVEEHDVEIAFETGSLAGHVYGPNGETVAGYSLTALGRSTEGQAASGSSVSMTKTREDGSFEFTDLLASTYRISAGDLPGALDSSASALTPHLGSASVSGIEVSAGSTVQGVDLRLPPAAAIEVLVVDGEGSPVEKANLECRPEGQSIHMASRAKSDASGKAVFGGLNTSQYFLRASLHKEASKWVSCRGRLNETASVKLFLEPGTTLQISILENDQPAEACHLTLYDMDGAQLSSQLVRRGSIKLGPWTPGAYKVVATTRDREVRAEQVVQVSGQPSIPVRLQMQ